MDSLQLKTVCPAGKLALGCFSLSVVIFSLSLLSGSVLGRSSEMWALKYWGPALYFCLFNFILRYCYRDFLYEVREKDFIHRMLVPWNVMTMSYCPCFCIGRWQYELHFWEAHSRQGSTYQRCTVPGRLLAGTP